MFDSALQTALTDHLSEQFNCHCQVTPVSGGDINTCFLLRCDEQEFFLKSNTSAQAGAMFQTEAGCLRKLNSQSSIKIPAPIAQGRTGPAYYLVLEALPLKQSGDWEALGSGLAELHRVCAEQYGWQEDNFIGRTLQRNQSATSWSAFWWDCRLLPQLELACARGHRAGVEPTIRRLHKATEALLRNHQPVASLLHGDLWRGNAGFLPSGQPALFDPASYFGDRETDMALTRLFGGFPVTFYDAYEEAWPLPPGNQDRALLYNLYHLLNHLNLFGDGYLPQCLSAIRNLSEHH